MAIMQWSKLPEDWRTQGKSHLAIDTSVMLADCISFLINSDGCMQGWCKNDHIFTSIPLFKPFTTARTRTQELFPFTISPNICFGGTKWLQLKWLLIVFNKTKHNICSWSWLWNIVFQKPNTWHISKNKTHLRL